jgi:hypothetical protein
MVRNFLEGTTLTVFCSLSIRDVKKSKSIGIFVGNGCGYAGVHATGHKTNGQP